jgi:16S rRNA (guanine527-N7)-methyltransferase
MEKLFNGAKKLGIDLSAEQLECFGLYFQELIEWNKKVNLTHITEYTEVITKHFLDSLSVVLVWYPRVSDCVIDVGTGAGFPGLPLKITFPWLNLVLLEATAKKVNFLQYITQKLGLSDLQILNDRAETVAHQPEYREKFDIVLSRAVAELPTAVELTLPFCCLGGCFIAQKKGDITQELARVDKAIGVLGGKLREIQSVDLTELPDNRQLVVIDKISPTPKQYPRRPGMPGKRPLK